MSPSTAKGINNFSEKVRLLAFMEQSAVYNALNQGHIWNDIENRTSYGTVVNSFLCPSDANNPLVTRFNVVTATTCYGSNIGTSLSSPAGRSTAPPTCSTARNPGPP